MLFKKNVKSEKKEKKRLKKQDKKVEKELSGYFNKKTALDEFLNSKKMKDLWHAFKIDNWSNVSKLFLLLGIVGLVPIILSFFQLIPYVVSWFYVLIVVIFIGFIFTRPGEDYNITLVLVIFMFLIFIPSSYGQATLSLLSLEDFDSDNADLEGLIETLNNLNKNPFEDINNYVITLLDLLNWVVFLTMIGVAGSGIKDLITGDFVKVAKKVATIVLAIGIMVFVYGIMGSLDVPVRTLPETVGVAWERFMKAIGLAELSQDGDVIKVSFKSISNGLFSYVPLILSVTCLSLAYSFRKTDLKSILFAKTVIKDNYVEVRSVSFSSSILILFLPMSIYTIGYFLVTAEPTITINPVITLMFYVWVVVVLILIGFRTLILNTKKDPLSNFIRILKWTIFGIMTLWAWFQVFQPVMYELGFTDTSSTVYVFSQEASLFGSDVLTQFFLVAMPETLVFQIFFVGIGNRLWFRFKRERKIKIRKEELREQRWRIAYEYRNIKLDPNSLSSRNLRKLLKAVILKQKFDELTLELEDVPTKLNHSYFILPTIIFGLIGSFFFSWFHTLRRGIDFVTWWKNPNLGLVYFGAGFFLCLIAFFSYPAAILVHAINNIIAIMLSSGK